MNDVNAWEVQLFLSIPMKPEDLDTKHEGDAMTDFARRALEERLRPVLDALQAKLQAGYYIQHQNWGGMRIIAKPVWDSTVELYREKEAAEEAGDTLQQERSLPSNQAGED